MSASSARSQELWWAWLAVSLIVIAFFSHIMLESDDKSVFMPGPLTGGHHQIGVACDACHSEPFADSEVLQKACVNCHGDDRKKPFDSHPRSKFTDPRNADTLKHIDARTCVTCHVEHQPDMAGKNGLTQPSDFCIHCHSDIGEDRPSHRGMGFDTCNSAGCHNFHNNRALYTDYLVKHLHESDVLEKRTLPQREFADVLGELMDYPVDRYPVKQLTEADANAPANVQLSSTARQDWLETAHARSGVNCSACHMVSTEDNKEPVWTDKPDYTVCDDCHNAEVDRFKRGKHGMRLAVDLPAMTPSEARLPMKTDTAHESLNCNSCHNAHRFDVREAAAESCLGCHDDKHSVAYTQSKHYDLWNEEVTGAGKPGSGVSCASCHMPRVNFDVNDWVSRILVDHNQNATLSPNEKMIRPACIHCHGLGFTIDSLADRELIERNFQGRPAVRVKSMELAEADQKRAEAERASTR